MTEEYGRILVVKKDGVGCGGSCPITGDITFGRDKDSDVRIKLPSVSRNHAKITVDQNGFCIIVNISQTNPTLVNGTPVQSSQILNNGDEITVVERQFIFQNGQTQVADVIKQANDNLVLKHKLDSVDESLTTNFSMLKKASKSPLKGTHLDSVCSLLSIKLMNMPSS